MKIPSIVSTNSIKLLSGLGNNEDSLTAMIIKDWIGDGATVYTYKKEGGKDDAKEKAIEEFGTGAVWLFGIPLVKKLIDKTAYPLLKLNPNFDPRLLDNKEKLSQITNTLKEKSGDVFKPQKELFETLNDKNPVIKKLTNAQMYKGMAIAKFAVATVASAIALTKIIKYKQKTTTERIAKDLENQKAKQQAPSLVMDSVKQNKLYDSFTGQNKTSQPSFTGGLAEFMYNPIKNTMILDGVITTTRLKEARPGERKEVLFKEACQIGFIYGLAKPLQKMFEFIGKKIKCPIELDPKVLFSKDLKGKIDASSDAIKTLKGSNNILKTISEMDIKSPLIELLDKDDAIATIKDKAGNIKGLDFLKPIDEDKVKSTLKNLDSMKDNIGNLKGSKTFKAVAVVGNVLIAAGIMGIIQPKLNILMRKILNNGDNRNPAIAKEEALAMEKVNAHQG